MATARRTAFVDRYGAGAIARTAVVVDPSGSAGPAVSRTKNASGLTVLACGNIHAGAASGVFCGPWVTVPV